MGETETERTEKTKRVWKVHNPFRLIFGLLAVIFILLIGGSIVIRNLAKTIHKMDATVDRVDKTSRNTNSVLAVTSAENQKFFETFRQLSVAEDAKTRQALLDDLRGFKFTPLPPTTAPPKPKTSGATTTSVFAPKSSTSTTSKPAPSTQPPTTQPPPTTTTTRPCAVTTPVVTVCPQRR